MNSPAYQPIYTPSQIRDAEAPLIALLGNKLMRSAAFAVAREAKLLIRKLDRSPYGARVLVLAGKGNNAGDALFAAAELEKSGARIYVWQVAERTHAAGLSALKWPRFVSECPDGIDLVLDGIVGIGAKGGLEGEAARAVAAVAGIPALAVDVPSGVGPMSGRATGASISAQVTVTFGGLKPVHVRGFEHCGEVKLYGLGIEDNLGTPWGYHVRRVDHWPYPGPEDDKYSTGVVGIHAGSEEYPGAAVLATLGAVRATSAMVRYAGPSHADVVRALPEVVATQTPAEAGRVQAWVYGPGAGVDRAAMLDMLARPEPLLIDADGITALAASETGINALCDREAFTVLTPHRGEFERLTTAQTAQQLAHELGVCVLLKGRVTEVAYGDELYLIEAGSSWAATPGSGDVLSGIIGAAIAAEPTARMVANAVRMHANAAALCGGPVPAGDIARALTQVIRP
ncbi:bifunctional ADP-dependent NAD(P)H-hydrate dehydratase/NAD(P)H-hydrate epimerase [Corynebacterium epidermidicanis]|uniref:ADP-dependent (S)-NAD(P)H-hydrate dehydratase n=1 Tax=Corynebacterium epidermidicanis TaxID=1050174 RepID=A0A0G3GP66_9CORY|nr:bifunctional ADP-dependent NAD(P)H-hydrate dehydratase/NAD(P)H-hydrate epimerase [Corynebacterium epidermidicanis]AKK02355.1 putative sugar kinase [Corynebacterium epidermidicanis]